MAIPQHELKEMNRLLEGGMNISDIWAKYSQYDYWEIYWSVSDYSLLGRKEGTLFNCLIREMGIELIFW